MRLAVIADVHGNRWALEAVLSDVDRRGAGAIVDLGDSVYGPLDPAGTAALLMARGIPGVRGNEDRIVVEAPSPGERATVTRTRSCLTAAQRAWLAGRPAALSPAESVLACHGTPARDDAYLVEAVSAGCVRLRTAAELAAELGGVTAALVLCGHSHVPRLVSLPEGRFVVNPGSVGLQAYADDAPPHAMEAGSPHARYAIAERRDGRWRIEHVAVEYDWGAAAARAEAEGRGDWAAWLRTGRAYAPVPGGS